MDKAEALAVVRSELNRWREHSWSALSKRIGSSETTGVTGVSGTLYQVQIQVFWDDKPEGVIRVSGAVDDGGLRAFMPLTDDFLLSPDGTFVGE